MKRTVIFILVVLFAWTLNAQINILESVNRWETVYAEPGSEQITIDLKIEIAGETRIDGINCWMSAPNVETFEQYALFVNGIQVGSSVGVDSTTTQNWEIEEDYIFVPGIYNLSVVTSLQYNLAASTSAQLRFMGFKTPEDISTGDPATVSGLNFDTEWGPIWSIFSSGVEVYTNDPYILSSPQIGMIGATQLHGISVNVENLTQNPGMITSMTFQVESSGSNLHFPCRLFTNGYELMNERISNDSGFVTFNGNTFVEMLLPWGYQNFDFQWRAGGGQEDDEDLVTWKLVGVTIQDASGIVPIFTYEDGLGLGLRPIEEEPLVGITTKLLLNNFTVEFSPTQNFSGTADTAYQEIARFQITADSYNSAQYCELGQLSFGVGFVGMIAENPNFKIYEVLNGVVNPYGNVVEMVIDNFSVYEDDDGFVRPRFQSQYFAPGQTREYAIFVNNTEEEWQDNEVFVYAMPEVHSYELNTTDRASQMAWSNTVWSDLSADPHSYLSYDWKPGFWWYMPDGLLVNSAPGNSTILTKVFEDEGFDLGDESETQTEISEFGTETFSVYPNPTMGILNFTNVPFGTDVEIFNSLGQELNLNFSGNQVDISDQPTGIYFLKVGGETRQISKQ